MTKDEAFQLIARMASAWSAKDLDEAAIGVWDEHLRPKRADLAFEAVKVLEANSKWFPAIAEFEEAYHCEAEYDRIVRAQDRGLPTPTGIVTDESTAAGIQACRDALRRKSA